MKRSLLAALLACIVVVVTSVPHPAEAARRGRAAGAFIGGVAAGALLGGLMAPAYAYPRYYPPYAYPGHYYGPVYYGHAPAPRCFRRFESVWNGYRWYRRRVLICY